MPDEATTTEPAAEQDTTTPEAGTQSTGADSHADGAEQLGDAGKRALDAMKAERDAAIKALRAAENGQDAVKAARESAQELKELKRFKAEAEGRLAEFEAEQAANSAANEAREQLQREFSERYRNAEVALAAKGRVDPDIALRLLDLDSIEVADDGTVDSAAINEAIDALITKYPNLSVQDGPRFTGSADAGPRNADTVTQLTDADLSRMTPQQINTARREGRLNRLMGVK